MEKKVTGKLLQAYEEHLQEEEKSSATIEKYRRDLKVFCGYLRGQEVTGERVRAYREWLIERYAVSSVNAMLASVNSLFRYLGWNECRVRQVKQQRKIFCAEKKELTREEYFCLLKTAQKEGNHRLYMLMQTLGGTGIRISELSFITVEAVRRGQAEVRCKGKSRVVLLPEELCRNLIRYIRQQKIQSGVVFRTKSGEAMDRSNIWRSMKRLCRKAGVEEKKVFPHNFRHLFARTYYGVKKDIARLADILGHSSIETTRIYLMSTGKEQRRQISALGLVPKL